MLFLAIIGMTISGLFQLAVLFWWRTLPLYLIYLGPLLTFIGGGDSVLLVMLYTIVADISTEQERYEALYLPIIIFSTLTSINLRAIHFLWMSLGVYFAAVIGPVLGASLMKISPWLAEIFGVTLVFFGLGLGMYVIPETLHFRKQNMPILNTRNEQNKTLLFKLNHTISGIATEYKEASRILKSTSVVLLLLSFFPHFFVSAAEKFSVVYVSKRYKWLLSDTSYLLSLLAGINILLLLAIIPWISHFLASPTSRLSPRYRLTTPQKDLLLARISILILAAGALIVAGPSINFVIFGLCLWPLGNGFTNLLRSVITTMVNPQYVARLYSLISMVDTLGAIAVGPALPWLFKIGLNSKEDTGSDTWLGLPFLGTSALCGVVAIIVFCVKLPKSSSSIEGEEEEIEEEEERTRDRGDIVF